jgi:hypothetical protein
VELRLSRRFPAPGVCRDTPGPIARGWDHVRRFVIAGTAPPDGMRRLAPIGLPFAVLEPDRRTVVASEYLMGAGAADRLPKTA